MSDTGGAPDEWGKGQLEREAAQWCVKMHGPDAELHRPQFEAWLRLGALHRYTYNRIDEVYVMSGRLGSARSGAEGEPLMIKAGATPIRKPGRAWLAAATALTLGGALAVLWTVPAAVRPGADGPADRPVVRLEAGASTQRFRLSDGSIVALRAGSALVVSLNSAHRDLRLVSGGGEFRVAHEARPFTVAAAGGRITARGTRFDVAVTGTGVDVRLLEGRIDVAYPQGRGRPPIVRHLTAGETIRYPAAPPPKRASPALPSQPATVGELVDRANAGADGSVRIEIADPSLRAVAISGTFGVHDPLTTADRLAAMLGLVIGRPRPGVISLARRSP